MKLTHYSPSSLNLFCASPSMFVLEKVIGRRQPVGVPAYRGTAVEAGVTAGLMEPEKPVDECIAVAHAKYDAITALSLDARRAQYRADVGPMVTAALEELRPYGVPSETQGKIEWQPEGLSVPILGYFDFHWADHNITIDLKTTEKMPSAVKIPHARQVALYVSSNNADARVSYVTPKKRITYRVDNIDDHRKALHQIALRCEQFLALSDDPEFFTRITAPDFESFYWGGPARQVGFEMWGF
jgi:hypothetical protein